MAALGALDAIDVLPFSGSEFDLWYSLLNCGFRIAPGAGTDAFTGYRGTYRLPGGGREYVEAGPAMEWNRWIARYREGRCFVTSGPLLTFTVNGQPMGSVIRVPAGQSYRARLSTTVTGRDPLRRVTFYHNGKAVESRELGPKTLSFQMEKEVEVTTGSWFAVRADADPPRGLPEPFAVAHSGPVYVEVGGRPALVREDIELMIRWTNLLWNNLEERNNFGPGDNRQRARRIFDQALEHYRVKLRQP